MAGGLYRRLKTWGLTEVPQATDLNKEFDNVKNNFMPQMMASFTQNVAQMKLQTSPGSFNNESLATALSDELQRYRYQFAQIIGGPNGVWYDPPPLTLSQINTLLSSPPQNQIISGRTSSGSLQPMHIVPNGSSVGITLKATTTNFVAKINNVNVTFTADIAANGFTQPPSTQNTATINNGSMTTENSLNTGDYVASYNTGGNVLGTYFLSPPLLEEYPLTVSSMGTNISNLIGTYQAFSYQHGAGTKEYFIGFIASATQIIRCFRGYFFDSSDAPIVSQSMVTADTITLIQLTWIYLSNAGVIAVSYTNPRYSSVAPSTPSVGDYWYDLINQEWKSYNGSSWVVSNSILIGVCVQDGTNTVGARSFDTYRGYSEESNVIVANYSTTEFRSLNIENKINLYGSTFIFDKDFIRWNIANLDTGVTISSNTTYYCYLSETGVPYISNRAPHRRWDLGGYYHPSQPWRCVSMVWGTGSNTFDPNFVTAMMKRGEGISDKTLSISTRKNQQNVTTPSGGPAAIGPKDCFSTSNSTSPFTTTSASPVTVKDSTPSNITVSQYSSGRGINIYMTGNVGVGAAATVTLHMFRSNNGGNAVIASGWQYILAAAETLPLDGLTFRDYQAPPGLNTYTMQAQVSGGVTLTLTNVGFSVEEA